MKTIQVSSCAICQYERRRRCKHPEGTNAYIDREVYKPLTILPDCPLEDAYTDEVEDFIRGLQHAGDAAIRAEARAILLKMKDAQ